MFLLPEKFVCFFIGHDPIPKFLLVGSNENYVICSRCLEPLVFDASIMKWVISRDEDKKEEQE